MISLERKYTKISKFKALVLVSFISAFVFNACSGSSGSDLDPVPVKDIKDRVNRNSMLIETMEASGNIAFDSPEQSGQGWIEVRLTAWLGRQSGGSDRLRRRLSVHRAHRVHLAVGRRLRVCL